MTEKNRYVRAKEKNKLTPVELAILQKLSEGFSGKTMAYQLGKAPRTLSLQMRILLKHTKSKNAFQLALWAVEHGYTSYSAIQGAG